MKIPILHLSDLHLTEGSSNYLARAESVVNFVNSVNPQNEPLIVILSGDLTQAGNENDFAHFNRFVERIKDKLNNDQNHFFIVPGNHDCDLSNPGSIRTSIIKDALERQQLDHEQIQHLLLIQKNFFENWSKRSDLYGQPPAQENRMKWQKSINYKGVNVNIYGINTALLSTMEQNIGTHFFPIEKLDYNEADGDFSLSVFHHPYNWLIPDNARSFREAIETNSDIVFTGHEHVSGAQSKENHISNVEISIIEGGHFSDHKNSKTSSFNYVILDSEKGEIDYSKISLNNEQSRYEVAHNVVWQGTLKSRNSILKKFKLKDEFHKKLNELPFSFLHSGKENVLLSDLFVYPDLEEMPRFTKKETKISKVVIRSENVVEDLIKSRRVLITGGKSCGKTSLARRVFVDLRQKQLLPLLINGDAISYRMKDEKTFLRFAEREFNEQYHGDTFNGFLQTKKDLRILIIDDFHLGPKNHEARSKILEIILKYFDNVIIFADDLFRFDEFLNIKTENILSVHFSNWSIRTFGKRLKDKLIEKWINLGNTEEMSKTEQFRKRESFLKNLENIIETKAIPSVPLNLITLLQSLEGLIPSSAFSGSYGYLYRSLIDRELQKYFSNFSSIPLLETYLGRLFTHIYFEKKGQITIDDLDSFNNAYKTKYSSTLDFPLITDRFIKIGVFSKVASDIRVGKYYYLQFFIAKELSDGLSQDLALAKSRVIELINKIHLESESNIITCLCYLSQNSLVRDELLKLSRNLFKDEENFNFETHTDFLKELSDETIREVLCLDQNEDPEKNRQMQFEYDDEMRASSDSTKESRSLETVDEGDTKSAIDFNQAMRTISVLGQMLRCYASRIEAEEQMAIARECFDLSLRTLRTFMRFFEDNTRDIVTKINEDFGRERGLNEQAIKNFIYLVCVVLSVNIVERTASSCGADELRLVFKDLVSKDGSKSAVFMEYSVRLNYSSETPIGELRQIASEFEKSKFAIDSLKYLMTSYLKVNLLDAQERQQIVDILKLSPKNINKPLLGIKNREQ